MNPILVVGLPDAGADTLAPTILERVHGATLLVGGRRHLARFPSVQGERLAITSNMDEVATRLRIEREAGGQPVVLASGDPLWFGIAATLRRYFPAEALEILPAPTSAQMAFAALAEPWAGAALLSAHARPLADVVRACSGVERAAILTDPTNSPAAIARALLAAGHPPSRPAAIAENLGGPAERLWRGTLAEVAEQKVAPLNLLLLLPLESQAEHPAPGLPAPHSTRPPLPDDAFAHRAGLITKQEIRTLSLAALQPAGALLWDIGAGCGSVAIEAALMGATVWAIEKNEADCELIRENIAHFGVVERVHLVHGRAPEDCADWPAPDGIFVGGSGGELETLLREGWRRLRPGGRLVINLATIENLVRATTTLRALDVDPHLIQVNVARGRPILDMTRFEALNPVWIVSARKARDGREVPVRGEEAAPPAPRPGRLTVVGVGPGDPELITLKGLRRLQAADVVVVPRAEGARSSQAEQIAGEWLDLARQELLSLEFPLDMSEASLDGMWQPAAERLAARLLAGEQLVYLIVGDPLLFGSFVYLWEHLAARYPQIPVEIIPGISSVNAGAAAAGLPLALGGERVALLPAAHEADATTLRRLLADFDTVVLLKAGRALPQLLPILEAESLLEHATVVERATLPEQRVFHDVRVAAAARLSYWTLLIIHRPRGESGQGNKQ